MRRILTEAEIALDAKRDEHRKKWMGEINKAQTGAELEDILSKVTPMEGNPVETNTTRRLPKRYLEQYREVIQPLVILGWSLEEIREVLQRISARRITHQLVLTYVEKISVENHESDIAEAIKAGRRIHSSAERKEIVAQSDRRTAQLLATTPVKQESPQQLKSVWDDELPTPTKYKLTLSRNKKGFVTIDLSGEIQSTLKPSIIERIVDELEPRLSQDPDGVKLLEHLKNDEVFKRTLKVTDASIYLLFVMTRQAITRAGWATSRDMDKYFKDIKGMPYNTMKWLILEGLKEDSVSTVSIFSMFRSTI